MHAAAEVEQTHASPVVVVPRMFRLEEVGWLANEARVLRALRGHQVWIDDPDLGGAPFNRLAYHPRLISAVAAVGSPSLGVARTTLLYARRGIISPSAPYWRPEEGGSRGPVAVVFLGDAEINVADRSDGRFRGVEGAAGDVALLSSTGARLTATTDGPLAPLFVVRYGDGAVRSRGGRPVSPPKLADDCLWQPAYWTAG